MTTKTANKTATRRYATITGTTDGRFLVTTYCRFKRHAGDQINSQIVNTYGEVCAALDEVKVAYRDSYWNLDPSLFDAGYKRYSSDLRQGEVIKRIVDLQDGDIFCLDTGHSFDGGRTWDTCALYMFGGCIAVYYNKRRDENAPTIRRHAENDDQLCVVKVRQDA